MKWLKIDSKSIFRYLSWIVISILLIAATYYVWNDRNITSPIEQTTTTLEQPLELSHPVMKEFENDKIKLYLVSEHASIYEQKKVTKLFTISARIYEENEVTTRVRSKFGEMNSQSGLLHLWGEVQVDMKDGQRLNTEEIFFNQNTNVIYNDVPVTAVSRDDTIKAESMNYDITKGILLLNQPKANLQI